MKRDKEIKKKILLKEKHYLSFVFWNKNNYILLVIKKHIKHIFINGIKYIAT